VKFHITDNLPDTGIPVFREEILILMAVAPSLSPFFAETLETASESTRDEVTTSARRPVRPSEHAAAS